MKRRILVTAIAVLILTGCAPQADPSAEERPTSSSSASPTSSPTPAPSSSGGDTDISPGGTGGDGGALSGPQTWTIGFGTYGPLTVGSSYSGARAGLGEFTLDEQDGPCLVTGVSGPTKLDVVVGDDDVVDAIVFGLGLGVPVKQGPATAAGISIGSTEAELLAAYPGIVGRTGMNERPYYSTTDGSGRYLNFIVSPDWDDVVVFVMTSSTPDIPPEFC